MKNKEKDNIDQNEQLFFNEFYKDNLIGQEGNLYNMIGWRLRLERELGIILALGDSPMNRLGRILSIGCGDGHFELMLAPFVDEIVAIDLSSEAIKYATNKAKSLGIPNIHFKCMSVYELDSIGEFDVVIALAFFHHISESDLPQLLKNIYKLLKPDGRLYSTDPNARAILRQLGKLFMGKSYNKFHSPDERELNPDDLVKELINTGFETVNLKWTDFTLIPSSIFFKRGPAWLFHSCRLIDSFLARTRLGPWASSFGAISLRN